jgi:heme-degrading monooxygenase HmoA
MNERPYTAARWKVKPGSEAEFIEAWKSLGDFFLGLPHPPGPGTLFQNVDDPTLFYSFGPWDSLSDIAEMRSHPDAAGAIGQLVALCDEAQPGTFQVAATAE